MIDVSFIIPTLNAQKVLGYCLRSIKRQKKSKIKYEILVIDGGSSDRTVQIAKKYKCKILKNPLKTAEAGKAIGVKKAKGKFICLIDSDNIIPDQNWLESILQPFDLEKNIIGSEPIRFTYRPHSGFIERYSALFGINDPYAWVTKVYDRQNLLNNKWTGLKINQIDKKQYILATLEPNQLIPTIGANGTVFKTEFLRNNLKSDYLFDIDIISQVLQKKQKPIYFAKTKIGIIHTFCESSISKFIRKQKRRLTDYFFYQNLRKFNWHQTNQTGILKYSLYTISVILPVLDSTRGFLKKPDLAWFFHPFACLITLIVYSDIYLKNKLGLLKATDRHRWVQ